MFWELNEVPKWPLTSSKLLSIPSLDSPFRSKMLPGGPWSAQASSAHRALVSQTPLLAGWLHLPMCLPESPGHLRALGVVKDSTLLPLRFLLSTRPSQPKNHSGQQEVWDLKEVRAISSKEGLLEHSHEAVPTFSTFLGQMWTDVASCGQMWSAA